MSRFILSVGVACLAACLSSAAVAAQYWVSIGSFSTQERAERGRSDAVVSLAEPLSVSGSQTATGYYYRVLAGPYPDRNAAQSVAEQAKLAGFTGAWVVADADDSLSSSIFDESLYTYDDDYDDGLAPLPGSSSETVPDAEGDGVPKPKVEREMVDEPPPGYRLHKLRRDAMARPPPGTSNPSPDTIEVNLNTGSPLQLSRLPHSESEITVDGKLDEAVWQSIEPVTDFHAIEPDTLAPVDLRTELRVFYTDRGLYASFDMDQAHSTFVQWIVSRDGGFDSGDHVGITLDTSGDGLYGYWMSVSLGNVLSDGTLLPERRFSRDWNGAWYGRAARTEAGWSAEFFVPWSQLTMPKQSGTRRMGLYASRKLASRDIRWGVPSLPPTQSRFISAMRPMMMEGVDPRQQWSVFPYSSVTHDEVEPGTEGKVGADVFWRPSTNFQLTATLNPDFGNVESDDVVVNLSAFETFFRERRLFFLEGREIFETTPRSDPFRNRDPVTVVNTRRIGGSPRPPAVVPDGLTVPRRELGQPTELYGAVKSTGQFGRLRYGVLGASEKEVKFDLPGHNLKQDGSDYGVARFLYEDSTDGSYRAVGTISTLVAHPEQDVMVHGIDGHFRSKSGQWLIDSQLLYSDKDGSPEGYGGFTDVVYAPRRGLSYSFGLSHFDQHLDINDLGFLRRNDVTNARATMRYTNSSLARVRELAVRPFAQWEWNGDGRSTRRGLGTDVDVLLNNLGRIETFWGYFPKRYEDRESFGNGTYEIEGRHDIFLRYESDESRRLSYYVNANAFGEHVDATSYRLGAGIIWRPLDRLTFEVGTDYARRGGWLLHQEDENFTTFETTEWRPKLSFEFNFNARQQLRLLAQWISIRAREKDFYQIQPRVGPLVEVAKPGTQPDDFNVSNLNVQLRYRWELAPLSELFVVYTLNGFRTPAAGTFEDLFDDALDNPDIEQWVVKFRYRLGS